MTAHRLFQVAVLLFLSGVSAAGAQVASLVRDINAPPVGFDLGSVPRSFVQLGSKVLFTAHGDGTFGTLWATDGSSAGTEPLAAICAEGCQAPTYLTSVGNLSFWLAKEENSSIQSLWRSDGTRAGTFGLTGRTSSAPESRINAQGHGFTTIGDALLFTACSAGSDCDLWASDGTAQGTRRVADMYPLALTAFRDRGYFLAIGPDGAGLWATDGTSAGTIRVKALPAGGYDLVAGSDQLFFLIADDGSELWVSDGSEAGTRRVAHGHELSPVSRLKAWRNEVYFTQRDLTHGGEAIWRSDGTAAGTVEVAAPGGGSLFMDDTSDWAALDDNLVFFARGGGHPVQLWATGGDAASTLKLADLLCTSCSFYSLPLTLTRIGDRVYFPFADGEHGLELWSTDGTVGGTAMARDLCPGPCGGLRSLPLALRGRAFYVGTDAATSPLQLWRTDGTAEGTARFGRLPAGAEVVEPHPESARLSAAALGGRVVFAAADTRGAEPWISDGTAAGTRLVRNLYSGPSGSQPSDLTPVGEQLAFLACDESNLQVWFSSGTAANTYPAAVVRPSGGLCEGGRGLARAGEKVLFRRERRIWATDASPSGAYQLPIPIELVLAGWANGAERALLLLNSSASGGGTEVWATDGTPQGTARVVVLPQSAGFAIAAWPSAPELYFMTSAPPTRLELWKTDGTAQGTRKIATHSPIPLLGVEFIRVGDTTLFVAGEPDSPNLHLWATDGTSSGTRRVRTLGPIDGLERQVALVPFDGALYLLAPAPDGGLALWRSDGTADGTIIIHHFPRPSPSQEFDPIAMAALEDRLLFTADDGVTGREIWLSDGTPGGTHLLADLWKGPRGSRPAQLTAADGRVFFAAHDGVHGLELWQSDGSATGTRLIHDLMPDAGSSRPQDFTVAGGRLYFSADDGVHGRELWVLDLAQPAGVCIPSETALCLGGRFRVEAAWRDFAGNRGAGRTVPLTADTGAFWFFGPENIEVILKVLDGRGLNDHHWVFYGALSSVEYALTVTDLQTGITSRYWNPSGQLASVADTTGFGPLGAFSVVERSTSGPPPRVRSERVTAAATGPCVPSPTRLCLRGGRFAVEAAWKDFSGNSGVGSAVPLTGDTGYFWFFGADNVEVVLKVLDGTPVNGKHWVFYGALSSVEYTLRVTDTATGAVKTYTNKSGNLASVADTGAF